jgi:hypothetical protein
MSVTPTSGGPLTAKMLMSAQTKATVTITDVDATEHDDVCSIPVVVTAADLLKGAVSVSSAGSCKTLTVGLTCASPGGPGPILPQ